MVVYDTKVAVNDVYRKTFKYSISKKLDHSNKMWFPLNFWDNVKDKSNSS